MALVADTWGKAPSDYLPDLKDYERFCVDQAAAVILADIKEKAREEAEKERKSKDKYKPQDKGAFAFNPLDDSFKRSNVEKKRETPGR